MEAVYHTHFFCALVTGDRTCECGLYTVAPWHYHKLREDGHPEYVLIRSSARLNYMMAVTKILRVSVFVRDR